MAISLNARIIRQLPQHNIHIIAKALRHYLAHLYEMDDEELACPEIAEMLTRTIRRCTRLLADARVVTRGSDPWPF